MAPRIDPYSLIGTTLRDRYTVVAFGGVGRFSAVYRAIEEGTERPVALRFLKVRGHLTPGQRTVILERLGTLAQPITEAAAQLTPADAFAGALDVSAFVASDGRWMPMLVQPWVDGRTLESVLAAERRKGDARRTLAEVIELLSPIADALQYAHQCGLAHGSLCPRNLVVRGPRRSQAGSEATRPPRVEWPHIQMLDLGMVGALGALQVLDRAFSESPSSPRFFVTAYGAPEQFGTTFEVIGPAVDVFALALVVVALVTGEPPLGEGNDERLERAASDPAYRPTPRRLGAALGPYVEAVLERALAVRAEDRYSSVTSFWEALRVASRVMLRGSSSNLLLPPRSASVRVPALAEPQAPEESFDAPIPKAPALPDLGALPSIFTTEERETPHAYSRPLAAREPNIRARGGRPPPLPRETIPAHTFFAPPEQGPESGAAVSVDEVASVTNPLFGGIGRSVAPLALDVSPRTERAPSARFEKRSAKLGALAASFILGASAAALGHAGIAGSAGTAVTPLPADVLAAYAAIKPAVLAPCPAGMVRVGGAAAGAYCIDLHEVTVEDFGTYLDGAAHGKNGQAPISNEWPGITFRDRRTFDPLCNARDPKGHAVHAMNCIDRQTAATYCAARGARLPTDGESERAAESVGNGADGAAGSVSEWTRDGYRARFADGVSDAKAVAAWRSVTGARSYAIGFRCAAD